MERKKVSTKEQARQWAKNNQNALVRCFGYVMPAKSAGFGSGVENYEVLINGKWQPLTEQVAVMSDTMKCCDNPMCGGYGIETTEEACIECGMVTSEDLEPVKIAKAFFGRGGNE